MAIALYPHNENAYLAALAMLRETGKAAVIHPTGTGKSFIGFKLCEDFPERRICWLSPSEYIFMTQLENLVAESGTVPENITFLTYARPMALDKDEIAVIQPDYIILDEFHRCGAEQWGQGVQTLLNTYPNTPLLGLSATNIRFLDNQRDMAKELFEGYIASEISLGEAIAWEILKPPKYVLSVYSLQKDLEKYENRVEKLRNPLLRDRAEELLKTLRRSLENADSLDVIFNRHILDRLTASWDEMYIYAKAYYEKMGHLQIPMTYKTENGCSLGLWIRTQRAIRKGFSRGVLSGEWIAKLNAIGMCWTVREKERWPEYFAAADYAKRFDHLNVPCSYTTSDGVKLGKWLSFLKTKRKQNGEGQYLTRERIAALDKLGMVWDVDKFLWEQKFEAAQRYFQEPGNLQVPARYMTSDETRFGAWIHSARDDYRSGRLDEASIRRLEDIGMVWDGISNRWEWNYQAAQAFYREHGDLKVPSKYVSADGLNLGMWIHSTRKSYRNGMLDREQIDRLEQNGMLWNTSEQTRNLGQMGTEDSV